MRFIKIKWQNLTVPKNEFHPSLSINYDYQDILTEEEFDEYRDRVIMRRMKAHERDLQ